MRADPDAGSGASGCHETAPSNLVICDRCEKVRIIAGDVPDGSWTCCLQEASSSSAPQRGVEKGKGKAVEDQGAPRVLSFACVRCSRVRQQPDASTPYRLCCDLPDDQLVGIVGSTRVAAQLSEAGVPTQEALAAVAVDDEDGGEVTRVARRVRVNANALFEWIAVARGRELDEIMAEVLAPADDVSTFDVKAAFAHLEQRAGVSTPADLLAAPVETTLLPALRDLGVCERDIALWKARAAARLESAPAWMGTAKTSFPTVAEVNEEGEEEDEDHTDDGLLRAALDAREEHPDANCAGEAVQYLFRLSCNIAESPDELRYRRVRMENKAYLAHAVGVPGGTLAMDAMGWEDAADGSSRVLPEGRCIGTRTLRTLQDRLKAMVARAALSAVVSR